MENYEQYDEEIATAQKSVDAIKAKRDALYEQQRAAALTKAQAEISRFKFTFSELGLSIPAIPKSPKKVSTVAPKYRNPETGDTWSGRGSNPPKWIKGQDYQKFLIIDQANDQVANEALSEMVNLSPCPTTDAIGSCDVTPTVIAIPPSMPIPAPNQIVDDELALNEQRQRDEAMS